MQDLELFVRARRERPHWPDIPVELRPQTEADGYAMQAAVHDRMVAAGARLEGYKVGCTSAAGQAAYGLKEPIYSGIFDTTRSGTLAAALARPMIAPAVECEIAFTVGTDLDGSAADISDREIMEACSACHLACEIVDNRYGDPHALGVPTLLADDFLHAGFVMGPEIAGWRELSFENLGAEVVADGTSYRGNSADVLKPLESMAWLVRKLGRQGLRLHAGQIVLTGTIVPPVRVASTPREVSLSIDGLGRMDLLSGGRPKP